MHTELGNEGTPPIAKLRTCGACPQNKARRFAKGEEEEEEEDREAGEFTKKEMETEG